MAYFLIFSNINMNTILNILEKYLFIVDKIGESSFKGGSYVNMNSPGGSYIEIYSNFDFENNEVFEQSASKEDFVGYISYFDRDEELFKKIASTEGISLHN